MKFCTNVYLDHTNPIEFQGHMSKAKVTWVFFCLHNSAATRGQYLALSKAWWSCIVIIIDHIIKSYKKNLAIVFQLVGVQLITENRLAPKYDITYFNIDYNVIRRIRISPII